LCEKLTDASKVGGVALPEYREFSDLIGVRVAHARGGTPRRSIRAITDLEVFLMIERLAGAAGRPPPTCCCHSFHATGITTYLADSGTMENAQPSLPTNCARTTKLYDRTNESPPE
jgi:hypothetical protein